MFLRSVNYAVILSTCLAFLNFACSPKKFSAETQVTQNSTTPTDPVITITDGAIHCQPRLNQTLESISISTAGTNPTVTASCNPSTVSYNWRALRNNVPVTINGLSGASSTPDFIALGAGTYQVFLNASGSGAYADYNSTTPLIVTVTTDSSPTQSVNCNPKINNSLANFTYTGTNPTIAANCSPAAGSYVWTTTLQNLPVVIPGLAGSSSTPNLSNLNPGIYNIYLNASLPNYNAYFSSQPLVITIPDRAVRNISETITITPQNNQLDILLVIDDSSSMLADNQRLAGRLEGFVSSLSTLGYDWQMCTTVTRAQKISANDPAYYWGASVNFVGNTNSPAYILKPSASGIFSIFKNTINTIGAGWLGTDDERAIKAAWWHLWNGEPGVTGSSGCYRPNAGLAVIILSDEDERSIGGDQTQAYYDGEKNKALESDDKPQTYVDYVRQVFGAQKRFTVNSIIVRPGDNACLASQDKEGSKSHFGVTYKQLSDLTKGFTGSICDSDYSTNLNYFKDQISVSQSSIGLQCTPINDPQVNIQPSTGSAQTFRIENGSLIFTPPLNAGSTVNLNYTCYQ